MIHKLADSVTQAQWAQKYSEAQAAGTRATKLELAGAYDEAFQTYIQAARGYLFLIRHSQDPETTARLRTVSNKLVERAEKIKQVKKGALKPVKKDRFALEEQDSVLARSSVLEGERIPRWTEEGVSIRLHRRPTLSSVQQDRGCSWKRASMILPGACIAKRETNGRAILQDNVSDCSLVAALIVAAEHHSRYGSKLGLSCLYPQDASGWPIKDGDGQYQARFLINGTWRKICLDDYLPTTPEGRMMSASVSTQDELWPALIEKAYLSLSGSYDFRGSNSANDLYTLSGWLPEHIPLRSKFRSEQAWKRLYTAFHLGKCVATVGTSKVLDEFLEGAGLIPSHNYAILDLREHNGSRTVEIMNPWRETRSSWSQDLRAALPGELGRPTLIIAWEEISTHFSIIHVNWNPTVFDFSDTAHITPLRISVESTATSLPSSDLWIFLVRHSKSRDDKNEYIGLQVSRSLEDTASLSTRPAIDDASTMTDDYYSLRRIANPSNARLFDVVVSHEGTTSDFSFSLFVFGNDKVRIQEGPPLLPYSVNVQGLWDGSTAGGNHTRSTFIYNPQYRITISPLSGRSSATCDVEIYARTSKETPINAKLLVSGGQRIGDYENRDVLAGSASYAYGRAISHVRNLKPGSYTLVVSSFQPRHEDTFELALQSSLPVQVTPIPPEGAGMYSRCVTGAWSEDSDGGSRNLKRNPIYKLTFSRPTTIKVRLQTPERPLPIAIQIFNAAQGLTEALARQPFASSEPYSDLVCGVVLPSVKLDPSPSGYLVIPSTFAPHTHASFVLNVYGDSPITLVELETPCQTLS
ncbi:Rim13p [Sporobolomyces salmoneus]|uniref:Rim13p n=1 Tax=Sporobolomyces salmoneus TaxID=183962 RepID=UPI00317C9341